VSALASVAEKRLPVEGPGGKAMLRVAEVDPLDFRNIAPAPTRDAEFVWTSLVLGRAVPTFQAARKLGISEQADLKIGGTSRFQVGAFAENGVPDIADVLVQAGTEPGLKLGPPTELVVGAERGTKMAPLASVLKKVAPQAELRRLVAGAAVGDPATQEQQATSPQSFATGGLIGTMHFEILRNGFIRPDPQWVADNIVIAQVPILGNVTCNRLLIPRLAGALTEIQNEGLAHLIDVRHYGGCYVPRFIDRDPSNPLSNHAFGLAIDLNTTTNRLGTTGNMDPRIVEIFRRWGFSWGGLWARPDPMHFELGG
jgi:hypothetical protein